jgi:Tfp pilus assembly protein PilN
MRAVNLIPADSRGRGSRGPSSTGMQVPVYVLLGFLAAAVALVTVYVLTNNTIADRTAQLTSLKAQVAQEQAAAARLGEFTKFSQLAQTRIETVRSIAAARFDWHGALADLSKVVPANTTLQSLSGTVVPGASTSGSSGSGTGGLRGALPGPAFELTGCTANQDDVARLMSELRLINGVTRVTLSNSQVSSSPIGSAGTSGTQICAKNAATFDLVVFFQPVANAGAQGVTSVAGVSSTTSTTSTTSSTSTTPTTSTTSTTPTTSTTSTTRTGGAQ